MKGHINSLSTDDKKKHFRHELGLGDPYARDGVYTDKYKLKMKLALGTSAEKKIAKKKLAEMGEQINESLSEYLERKKQEKGNG